MDIKQQQLYLFSALGGGKDSSDSFGKMIENKGVKKIVVDGKVVGVAVFVDKEDGTYKGYGKIDGKVKERNGFYNCDSNCRIFWVKIKPSEIEEEFSNILESAFI